VKLEKLRLRSSLFMAMVAMGLFISMQAGAAVVWDEQINGDLSGDYQNPTVLTLNVGDNHIIFDTVDTDLEYFTFNVAAGFGLSSVVVDDFVSTLTTELAFLAVATGTAFPTPSNAVDPTTLLGWVHFGLDDLDDDILLTMGDGLGALGFNGPLGTGDYTFWAQENGSNSDHVDLNFVLSVIPEPSSLALAVVGLLALGRRKRRTA